MGVMNWRELKKFIEENGVTDDDVIDYIDIGCASSGLELYLGADGTFRFLSCSSSQNYVQNERKGIAGDKGTEMSEAKEVMSEPKAKASWPDPTPEMLETPEFIAVWDAIKTWDISVPEVNGGSYFVARGKHVRAILDALGEVRGTVLGVSAGSWEYTALYSYDFPKKVLNELGAKGWELVPAIRDRRSNTDDTYILKRVIDAEREG